MIHYAPNPNSSYGQPASSQMRVKPPMDRVEVSLDHRIRTTGRQILEGLEGAAYPSRR